MARFQINGVWYDAVNYAAALALSRGAAPAPVVAPVVVAPAPVTITPVLTPAANFVNRSTIRFGIGERIALSFVTNPAGRTAASFGGLTWVVTTGPATVVNNPGNLGTATLTCGSDREGAVELELRTVALPARKVASKRITVVRPTDVVFARRPGKNTKHVHGTPSAGFQAITYLRPADVSFSNLEFREGGASYVGTGIFARAEASLAQLDQDSEVIHPIRAGWGPVNGGDSATLGSRVSGYDTVSTTEPTIGVGTFCWSIPQLVRVVGTRDDFVVKSLDHLVVTDALGNMTLSKGGVTVVHAINDPTSNY